MDVKKLMAEGALDNISDDLFKSVSSYSEEVKAFQRQKAAEYADQVVAALKKIEQDIKERYDRVGLNLEKRVLNIKDGKDGINGRDGRDGKDGKPGLPGKDGRDGKPGKDGNDGADGKDGVSVVNAFLDFDNSLVIELSNGTQVNAGAVLGADFAEKVKIIANGGGTSQAVLDTLASLQAQINAVSSLGFVQYQGTWNASTNTPTITSSVGTKGYYYVVSVAGSTSINSETKWGVGDWIVFNGSVWQKVDGGSTGNLTTLDVSSSATLSYGNGDGIAYLNAVKEISSSNALTFDGVQTLTLTSTIGTATTNIVGSGTSSSLLRFKNGTTGNLAGFTANNAQELIFEAGGVTERMRLNSTGLLIKTSSAINGWSYPLQVNGFVGIQASANNNLEIFTPNSGTGIRLFARNNAGTLNRLELQGGQVIFPLTTGADGLYFDASSGNLGIGTSSPAAPLSFASATGQKIRFYNGLSGYGIGVESSEFRFVTDNSASFTWGIGTYSSPSEQMRLTATGLGIGTSSPATKLDVYNATNADQYWRTSSVSLYAQANNSNGSGLFGTLTNHPLVFYTNSTERMRIDSSGNVGIGTTSPNAKLDIVATTNTIRFGRSTTSYASIDSNSSAGSLSLNADAGVAGAGGAMYFQVGGTERMRIDSSGNLLVGYTASNGSYLLQVNSQIYATNATIATSDGRYKESVQPIQNALSLISTLNPVSFKWKHHDVHNFAVGETDVGFIAQEVKQSLENTAYVNQVVKANTCTLTDGTEEEFLGIAEGKMIPLLVKAIQELKAEVDSLKAQLNK